MHRISVFLTLICATSSFAQDAGKNLATTIQLPTFGVAVDAQGELTVKAFPDPNGQLRAQRLAAARAQLEAAIAAPSKLRKVSLAAMEQALAARRETGDRIEDALRYVAGLQRVQYVFLFPESKDVVLAGPAEGWMEDPSGRVVGLTTGSPVIRLDDLAVALRVYAADARVQPFLGCTIDPPPEGLARLRQFQKSMPNVISVSQRSEVARAAASGTQSALGLAEVKLFGISSATHFAQVLVEADYRMKRLAMGLELPPVPMKTYLGSLRRPAMNALQRWWFTPNYQCLKQSEDELAMELVGQGVQLQTEELAIGNDGKLANVASPAQPAATAFAQSFTERYEAIAAASPVYAELRNLIDLAIVSAWLHKVHAAERTSWSPKFLCDEQRLATQQLVTPQKVACVANAVWAGNRLLVPAGGGVSITPDKALLPENLLPADAAISQHRTAIHTARPVDRWWWD